LYHEVRDLYHFSAIYKDISEYQVIQDASGSDVETSKTKLLLGKPVTQLNVDDHSVTLADGSVIYYHKVLLATGGKPKTLENVSGDHVSTFRNINDFKKLDKIAKEGAHVAIIGGGFLGSELAVALAHRGNHGLFCYVFDVFLKKKCYFSWKGEFKGHSGLP
jgi:programmed cell death 8 (apoptosis-inducing factor)